MTERTTQDERTFYWMEVPHVIEAHAETLATVVGRLIGGEMRSVGYVTTENGEERLTELGRRTLEQAKHLAIDTCEAVTDMEGRLPVGNETEKLLESLLYDSGRTFTVVAAALCAAADWPDPTEVTWGCERTLRDLLKRARSEEAVKAAEDAQAEDFRAFRAARQEEPGEEPSTTVDAEAEASEAPRGADEMDKRLAGVRRIVGRLPRAEQLEELGPDELEQFHEDVRKIDQVLMGDVVEASAPPDPSDAEVEEMVRESATRIRKILPTSLAEIEDVYNDLLFLSNAISGEEPHA